MSVSKNRSFEPKYAEFGKIFRRDSRGANEYTILDRSDEEIASITSTLYFNEIAFIGEKNSSPFTSKQSNPGNVSVAFITWGETGFLYLQVQRRREDEFVENVRPRTKRFFNQARLIHISKDDIQRCFQQQASLYSSLLYQNPDYPNGNRLKDYVEPEYGSICKWEISFREILIRQRDDSFFSDIVNTIYEESKPQSLVDGKVPLRLARPLMFIKSGLTLTEKLQIIDAAQYFLLPVLGIITFALDYITDRPVLLYLYDEPADSGFATNLKIVKEEDLKNFRFQDYFGVMKSLTSEEIHHETLAFYLRQNVSPEKAVKLFKLIETEFFFSSDEESELIRDTWRYITEEHWAKIVKRNISLDANYRELLSLLPISLRISSLKETLGKTGKNLAAYAPFHIAAVEGLEQNDKTVELFREILIEAIRNSSPEVLDQLSDDIRVTLYEELIRVAYIYREDRSSVRTGGVRFKSTDTRGQSILQVLITRGENAFLEGIQVFQPIDEIHHFLIDEILDGLEKKWCNWGFGLMLLFWNSIPNRTTDNFLKILNFLVRNPTKYSEIADNPMDFKNFLLDGSDLLDNWHRSPLPQSELAHRKIDNPGSLLTALSSQQEKKLSILLREACIEVSQPSRLENIQFGGWWLMHELIYYDTENFKKDYAELLDHYRNNLQHGNLGVSDQSLFLLSGGSLGRNLSLTECCKKYDVENQKIFLDEDMLEAILNIWIFRKIPIPTKDINYLIEKLPDENSNTALIKITLNDSREQIAAVMQLESLGALRWLKETDPRRMSYVVDNNDLLFERLKHLRKPSLELIHYMIIVDSGAYPFRGGWREYVNRIKGVYERYWKISFHDPLVEDYIILASQLMDFPHIGTKYRPVLKKMVEFRHLNQNTDVLRDDDILKGLLDLTYENEGLIQDVKRRADYMLLQFLRRPDLANLLGDLELSTIRVLSDYAKKESKLIDPNTIESLEKNHVRRNPSSTHEDVSGPESRFDGPHGKPAKTQPNTGTRHFRNDSAETMSGEAPIKRAKTTFFEIFLIVVLVLIITIIILEIWVATNPALSEKIWQPIREFLSR